MILSKHYTLKVLKLNSIVVLIWLVWQVPVIGKVFCTFDRNTEKKKIIDNTRNILFLKPKNVNSKRPFTRIDIVH